MKLNVGSIDRALRIIIGIVLIALAATNTVGWWGWLGIILLLTGLFRKRVPRRQPDALSSSGMPVLPPDKACQLFQSGRLFHGSKAKVGRVTGEEGA